ncbi:MAG: histone methylation DOT1 family protein [uncultured bacterium]|nr:MAG: histone methylation DOT1 family protein [uncultured bacterium]
MLTNLLLILILIFCVLLLLTFIINLFSGAVSVPSNKATIEQMLKEAKLEKGDVVYDLGCGDGRLLIQAEKKYGAIGIGYENAPLIFLIAIANKWINGSSVQIRFRNFFKDSLSNAKTIFLYLSPEVQKKLSPKIQKECKKNTLIVSNTFHVPELKLLKKIEKNKTKKIKTIYLYKL